MSPTKTVCALALSILLVITFAEAQAKQPAIYSANKLDQIFLYVKKVNNENSVLRLYIDKNIVKKDAAKVIRTLYKGAKGIYINRQRNAYHVQWAMPDGAQHDVILQVLKEHK